MPGEERIPEGVTRVRAPNPSAFTLDGTNTYIVEGWVIDPGPDDKHHLDAVLAAAGGAIAGIAITHAHPDHDEGAPGLAERAGGVEIVRPKDGARVGPLTAMATPGHARDHVAFLYGRVAFTGDAVAGTGSSFIVPGGGGLGPYLDALHRLRELDLEALCPGHGPVVNDPRSKLDEYIDHRLERERKLLAALEMGLRDRDELLDAAWDDVPWHVSPDLRTAAGVTLDAHLEKLRSDGRLPDDLRA
ncbi:MAG TPA: MBL fold metallo-hydrolase [Thermoleophilaceae bacterium]|nr:MBL fold metallo-hydrolase [Thermoleophilaceae bacterium]